MKKNKKKVHCPKCLGTGEFFNGFGMKKCKICDNGVINKDLAQSYINEDIIYE